MKMSEYSNIAYVPFSLRALPCFTRSVAGFRLQRPGFETVPDHITAVVFKVAVWTLFAEHFGLPLSIPFQLSTLEEVQESRNRAGVAQRVPGLLGSQIFTTFGT
jgi:hypothetical protein